MLVPTIPELLKQMGVEDDARRDWTVVRGWPAGKPRGDAYLTRKLNLYLRVDVIEWLRQEVLRRGNGASLGGVVTEIVRKARDGRNA